MNDDKRKALEAAGWKAGTAQEFLGLTDEEASEVKCRVARARAASEQAKAELGSGSRRGVGHTVKRTVHMCLDIKGALLNWSDREFVNVFKDDDGRPMAPREAKMMLLDMLADGVKVIPIGPRAR